MFDPDFDIDDLNVTAPSPPPGPDVSLVRHALEPDPDRLLQPGETGSDSEDELLKLAISNSLKDVGSRSVEASLPPGSDVSMAKHDLEPDRKRICVSGNIGSESVDEVMAFDISNSLQDAPSRLLTSYPPPGSDVSMVKRALEPDLKSVCVPGNIGSDSEGEILALDISNSATPSRSMMFSPPPGSDVSMVKRALEPDPKRVFVSGKTESDSEDENFKLAITNSLQDYVPSRSGVGKAISDSEDEDLKLAISRSLRDTVPTISHTTNINLNLNVKSDSEEELIKIATLSSLQDAMPSTSVEDHSLSFETIIPSKKILTPQKNLDHFLSESDSDSSNSPKPLALDFKETIASKPKPTTYGLQKLDTVPSTLIKSPSKGEKLIQESARVQEHVISDSDSDGTQNPVPSVAKVSKSKGKVTKEKKKKSPAKRKPDKSQLPLCQLKAKDALEIVTMLVDSSIEKAEWGQNTLKKLTEITYRVVTLKEPFTIRWVAPEGEQQHLLFVYDMMMINPMVTATDSEYFYNFFESVANRNPNYRLYLVIYGFKEFSRGMLEGKLLDLLVSLDFSITSLYYETVDDLALYLKSLTKAVSQEPYKELTYHKLANIGFYPDKPKLCINIDDGIGMKELWINHLSLFQMSNLDMAKAIAAVYPSPKHLIKAYETKSTQAEKDLMLKDIMVHKSSGRSRRIGPELSKKISTMYTSDDPKRYV